MPHQKFALGVLVLSGAVTSALAAPTPTPDPNSPFTATQEQDRRSSKDFAKDFGGVLTNEQRDRSANRYNPDDYADFYSTRDPDGDRFGGTPDMGNNAKFGNPSRTSGVLSQQSTKFTVACSERILPFTERRGHITKSNVEWVIGDTCAISGPTVRMELYFCAVSRRMARTCIRSAGGEFVSSGVLTPDMEDGNTAPDLVRQTPSRDFRMELTFKSCSDDTMSCEFEVIEKTRLAYNTNDLEDGGKAFAVASESDAASGNSNFYIRNRDSFDVASGQYLNSDGRGGDAINTSGFADCSSGTSCETDSDRAMERYADTGTLRGRQVNSDGSTTGEVNHGNFNSFGFDVQCQSQCAEETTRRVSKTEFCNARGPVTLIEHEHQPINYRVSRIRNVFEDPCSYTITSEFEGRQFCSQSVRSSTQNCWVTRVVAQDNRSDFSGGTATGTRDEDVDDVIRRVFRNRPVYVPDPENPDEEPPDYGDDSVTVTETYTCDDLDDPFEETAFVNNEVDPSGSITFYDGLPENERVVRARYNAPDFPISHPYQERCDDRIAPHPQHEDTFGNDRISCLEGHWRWYRAGEKIRDNDDFGISESEDCTEYTPNLADPYNAPDGNNEKMGACREWGPFNTGSPRRVSQDCLFVSFYQHCELDETEFEVYCSSSSDPDCEENLNQCQSQDSDPNCTYIGETCTEWSDGASGPNGRNVCFNYRRRYECARETQECARRETVCQDIEDEYYEDKDGGFERGMAGAAMANEVIAAMSECDPNAPQQEAPMDTPDHRRFESGAPEGSRPPPGADQNMAVCELELFGGEPADCEDPKGKSVGLSVDCCNDNLNKQDQAVFNECGPDDIALASAKRQSRAIKMGSYCSKEIGRAWFRTCVEVTNTYCIFDSPLSAAINQQGRKQLIELSGGGFGSVTEMNFQKYIANAEEGSWVDFGVFGPSSDQTQVAIWQFPSYCNATSATYTDKRDEQRYECLDSRDLIWGTCRNPSKNNCAFPQTWKLGPMETNWDFHMISHAEEAFYALGDTIAVDGRCRTQSSNTAETWDGEEFITNYLDCKYNIAFDERARSNEIRRTYEIAWPLRTNLRFFDGSATGESVYTDKQDFGPGWAFSGQMIDLDQPMPPQLTVRFYGPNSSGPSAHRVSTRFASPQTFNVDGDEIEVSGSCSDDTDFCIYRVVDFVTSKDKPWFPNRPIRQPEWGRARKTTNTSDVGYYDCSGFTLEQFQSLDLASMDLKYAMEAYEQQTISEAEFRSSFDGEFNEFEDDYRNDNVRGDTNYQELVRISPDQGENQWTMTLQATTEYPLGTKEDPDRTVTVDFITVDWGDGTPVQMVPNASTPITATHTYGPPNTEPARGETIFHDVIITFNMVDGTVRRARARSATWDTNPPANDTSTGGAWGGEHRSGRTLEQDF